MGYGLACGSSPTRPPASVSPSGGGVRTGGEPSSGPRSVRVNLKRLLLHPAARRQHPPAAVILSTALLVAVCRPDGDPTETDLVGEVRQGGRVRGREDLALDVVATDHRRGAEPRPELLGGQPKAGPPIGCGQLRVGGAQRARRRLAHAHVVRLASAVVHRHEVDAGEIHPRPEHLVHTADPVREQPLGSDRQREPHLERPIGRRLRLEGSDPGGPPHVRRGVVERGPLDVEIDHARLVPLHDRAVRVGEG